MKNKKKLLIIFGIILLVPIVLILLDYANQYHKYVSAKSKVAEARTKAMPDFNQKSATAAAALRQAGLITIPLASSKVDVCYVTHEDQGWFAANWYQDCYLRYVQGFETTATKTEALQKVSSLSDIFGEPQDSPNAQTVFKCELAESNFKETVRYRPAGSPISSLNECGIPDQLQGVFSVKGPIMLDNELSAKSYDSFNPVTVDNSKNQIWVMSDTYYYHEELGCGFGIFCANPRSKPARAE